MRRWRVLVVGVWLILLIACGWLIGQTRFTTDMSAFLPRAPSATQQMLVDQLREGVVSRLVLVAIEGAPPETLAALSKDLAKRLRAGPMLTAVANGEAVSRDREFLWTNRYLLSPGTTAAAFTPSALHASLEKDLALLGSDLGVMAKRVIPADPTGELFRIVGTFSDQTAPHEVYGVWFSPDEKRALLMVQSAAAGFDIDGQEQALDHIAAAFTAARAAVPNSGAARLINTGPPVFAVQSRARIKGDTKLFSAVATALVAAVLLVAYRSMPVLVLALLPVASGALAGVAAVGVGFGFVHGVTLGFGVTLIGEAVDYAIYLFTQTPPGAPTEATLPKIWPVLRLGMLTSVCGFSAMLLSRFDGFAQLGLFTIVGLVTALAVTRFVLPVLRPVGFASSGAAWFALPLLALMRRGRTLPLLVLAVALASVASIALHAGPYWEDELSSMNPLPRGAQTLDRELRHEIGAPDARYVLVIHAADRDQALAGSERLARNLDTLVSDKTISAFDAPSRWLPSDATQRTRQQALPDAPTLAAAMAEALKGTPFRPETFAPFLADVATARRAPLLQPDDLAGSSLGLRLDTLLVHNRDGWVAMLPLQGVTDPVALGRLISGLGMPGLVFLDLKAESDHLLATFRREALTLSFAGSAAIVLLLAISLRRPSRVAAVLLPLAAALVSTAATLLIGGGRLSIFDLFGLLLVVAVGSNYCLFFERPPGEHNDRRRMVSSLVLANFCTVIGFGILSFSGVPVLHGIGGTVAVGAFFSLLFAAMLAGRRTALT